MFELLKQIPDPVWWAINGVLGTGFLGGIGYIIVKNIREPRAQVKEAEETYQDNPVAAYRLAQDLEGGTLGVTSSRIERLAQAAEGVLNDRMVDEINAEIARSGPIDSIREASPTFREVYGQ